jgi:hypothetical protein
MIAMLEQCRDQSICLSSRHWKKAPLAKPKKGQAGGKKILRRDPETQLNDGQNTQMIPG